MPEQCLICVVVLKEHRPAVYGDNQRVLKGLIEIRVLAALLTQGFANPTDVVDERGARGPRDAYQPATRAALSGSTGYAV
ncbi:MAG: hypothetical protein QOJ56_6162 [Mycobacterium sp.]|nr:hypothetical protein [Mycobacterium sp.]